MFLRPLKKYIIFICFPVVLLFFCSSTARLYAQDNDTEKLYKEALELQYFESDNAIKACNYILKTFGEGKEACRVNLLLAEIYTQNGNYTLAIQQLNAAAGIAKTQEEHFGVALGQAKLCRLTGLYIAGNYFLQQAKTFVSDTRKITLETEEAAALVFTDSIKAIQKYRAIAGTAITKQTAPAVLLYSGKLLLTDAAAAGELLNKVVALKDNDDETKYYKLQARVQLCAVLALQGKLQEVNHLENILIPEVLKATDVTLKADLYRTLADVYLKTGDRRFFMLYDHRYNIIAEDLNSERIRSSAILTEMLGKSTTMHLQQNASGFTHTFVLSAGVGVLFILLGLGYYLLMYREASQFKAIISQLESRSLPVAEVAQAETKVYAIPEKTEKQLLEKLERFEASGKFTKNNVSLQSLAKQLDTNTKYLSEVINTHKGGNFNSYINELRVRYILKKLQTDTVYRQYKVSYLAEESGFSSHSAFATVFKGITGFSPTAYINMLNKQTETSPAV